MSTDTGEVIVGKDGQQTVKKKITTGSAHIINAGVTSQSRNRLRTGIAETYAAATNSCTWNTSDNIREITVLITATDSATAPPLGSENYALLAFNAASDGIAASMLTEADSASDDAQMEKILIGKEYTFRFTTALTRLDVLPVDASTTLSAIHMHVGAH